MYCSLLSCSMQHEIVEVERVTLSTISEQGGPDTCVQARYQDKKAKLFSYTLTLYTTLTMLLVESFGRQGR